MKKEKFRLFMLCFFSNDIAITFADIILKLCMSVIHIPPEGRVSQIYYLGPSLVTYKKMV